MFNLKRELIKLPILLSGIWVAPIMLFATGEETVKWWIYALIYIGLVALLSWILIGAHFYHLRGDRNKLKSS